MANQYIRRNVTFEVGFATEIKSLEAHQEGWLKTIISNRGIIYREKLDISKWDFPAEVSRCFFAKSSGGDFKFVAIVTGCSLRRKN